MYRTCRFQEYLITEGQPIMEESTLVHDPKARVLALISREFDQRISESVPLRRYYRSLTEIYRMASVYVTDGNMEAALILFTRYSWYITSYGLFNCCAVFQDYCTCTAIRKRISTLFTDKCYYPDEICPLNPQRKILVRSSRQV